MRQGDITAKENPHERFHPHPMPSVWFEIPVFRPWIAVPGFYEAVLQTKLSEQDMGNGADQDLFR